MGLKLTRPWAQTLIVLTVVWLSLGIAVLILCWAYSLTAGAPCTTTCLLSHGWAHG